MVRFGVVGTNWITDRFLDHVKVVEEFTLTAVFSRTAEKARAFADKYGVETIFTDLEEMAKSDVIDAVYIATPNALHAEQSILFLNHGKHVLCEKPLASNTREVDAMFQAARKNGVVLMEAMKTTFLPRFQAIQQNLDKLGTIRRYFGSYCQYSSRYDKYKEGIVLNAFKPELSNGALMDLGIYCIYPLVVLFGEPKRIQASAVMLESGVDGEGSLILEYDGMQANIQFSKISDSFIPSEIQGESGSIIIDHISDPSAVSLRYRNGETEDLTVDQPIGSMAYETMEFINLIKSGKTESEVNSYKNSRITASIMEEARRQIGLVFPADKK
ncbi:Gfo/Idh/MocA family protein [Tuberibacillus calidus]|uniref:Gfo/Idh/MocA family protein n=1 Tax=Tuberibacillus calidus TaxID=340097 RepID=UPI0004837D8C|nr:Gfo/Idh/MocA family oxidoreductase [Tuberibacillus calidus]